MRTIFIFLGTLASLLLLAEIGQKLTSFNKEGSFIVIFFYCSIISAIITGCNYAWRNNQNENLLKAETELANAEARKMNSEKELLDRKERDRREEERLQLLFRK